MITDLDFADDIELVSDTAEKGRKLLLAVEGEFGKVGLQLNARKTMLPCPPRMGLCWK